MNPWDAFYLGMGVATALWGWTLMWYRAGKTDATPIGPFR